MTSKYTQKHAGYVTGERCYCCKTCKSFIPKEEKCQIVSGKIISSGCCNLWVKGKKGMVC